MARQRVTVDEIATLRSVITTLEPPAPKDYSVRGAVVELRKEIREMMAKGLTVADLARAFTKVNISISPATLGVYVREAQASDQPAPRRKRTTPRRGEAEPALC